MSTHCKIFILAFLSSLLVTQAKGQAVELNDPDSKYIIGLDVELFFADNDSSYSIEQVSSPAFGSKFEKSDQLYPNCGYSTNEVWLRFQVDNQTFREDWYFHIAVAYIDFIDFYYPKEHGWGLVETGWKRPFDARGKIKTGSFSLPMRLPAHAQQHYYLRVKSTRGLTLPMSIIPEYIAYENSQDWHIWYGLYAGILGVMVLYNFFIYFTLKNTNYLYYALTIICTLFTFVSVGGYAYKYLYPNMPQLNDWVQIIAMAGIVVTTSIFTIRFLRVKSYSKFLFYAFVTTASVSAVLLLYSLVNGYSSLINTFVRIQGVLLLAAGIWCWSQGSKFARFFVLAWTFYIIGGIFMTLRNSGILPFNFWTSHGAEIGSALEAVLISLALSDQYRILRREREQATKKLLQVEQEAKNTLEAKVEARTRQLNESNEELKQVNEEMQQTLETVKEQHGEIAKKNHEITSGINYAKRIQQAILPTDEMLQAHLPEHFVLFRPCQLVSGDFYFFLEKDGLQFIAVVDCTGHGVPGALMSMVGYNLLREVILDRKRYTPDKILAHLHHAVVNALHQKSSGNRDGMDLGICVLNREKGELQFAGAKNSLLYVRNGEYQAIKGSRNSIGGQYFKKEYPFETHTLPLDSETAFYLYSDGYPDQFGGAKNRKFRQRPFRELLAEISRLPFPEQKNRLDNTLSEWMEAGGERQIDDVLVWGFR